MLVIRFSDSRACKQIRRGGLARRRSSSRFRKLALYLYLISCVELERLNNGRARTAMGYRDGGVAIRSKRSTNNNNLFRCFSLRALFAGVNSTASIDRW